MALLLLTSCAPTCSTAGACRWPRTRPNRFVINVQQEQMPVLCARCWPNRAWASRCCPRWSAGRLATRNGEAVDTADIAASADAADDGRRAQRRAEREFNLSTATALGDDNRVTAGRFWGATPPATPELSVEEGFAESLGWKLGDRIAFDIAGRALEGTVTSLRSVEWESFKPNFFVLASPGALDGYPASWITAVGVPRGDTAFTRALVAASKSVIDFAAVLEGARHRRQSRRS